MPTITMPTPPRSSSKKKTTTTYSSPSSNFDNNDDVIKPNDRKGDGKSFGGKNKKRGGGKGGGGGNSDNGAGKKKQDAPEEQNRPKNHLVTDASTPYNFRFRRYGSDVVITVHQTPDERTWPGGALWDVGVLMARVLVRVVVVGNNGGNKAVGASSSSSSMALPPRLVDPDVWNLSTSPWKERRILELGAGVGLTGLVASALGARAVLLTDLPDVIRDVTIPNANRNVGVTSWSSSSSFFASPPHPERPAGSGKLKGNYVEEEGIRDGGGGGRGVVVSVGGVRGGRGMRPTGKARVVATTLRWGNEQDEEEAARIMDEMAPPSSAIKFAMSGAGEMSTMGRAKKKKKKKKQARMHPVATWERSLSSSTTKERTNAAPPGRSGDPDEEGEEGRCDDGGDDEDDNDDDHQPREHLTVSSDAPASTSSITTTRNGGIPDVILIGDVAYQHKPGAPSHFDDLVSTTLRFAPPGGRTLVVFGTRMRMPASIDLLDLFRVHFDEIVNPPIEAHELDASFDKDVLGRKHNMTMHFMRRKMERGGRGEGGGGRREG